MGSLLATRLARKITDSFGIVFSAVKFFTDSSAVLGMLHCHSNTFQEFVGIRVAEIKKNSNVKDWAWVPTHANPADLGTRTNVVPADLGPDSVYQKGMDWMNGPHPEWPIKKEFTNTPLEERRKDISCAIIHVPDSSLARFRTLQPAVRALATVISAVRKWKAYKRLNPPIQLAGKYTGTPTPEELDIAKRFLISGAQKDFKKGELDSLSLCCPRRS